MCIRDRDYYELEGSGGNYYLWDGLLDNQTPDSAMMTTALGAVLMCLGLFILSRLLKKGHIESIQSFLDSHPEVTRDYLEADFQSAEKLAGRFWVGRYFTYGAYDKPEILSNEEITRAWYQVRSCLLYTSDFGSETESASVQRRIVVDHGLV